MTGTHRAVRSIALQIENKQIDLLLLLFYHIWNGKSTELEVIFLNKTTDYIPVGAANAISADELANRRNEDKRNIRKAIFQARQDGAIICSNCEAGHSGYYLPQTPAEAKPYLRQQRARLNSLKKSLKAAELYYREAFNDERQ